MNCLQDDKKFLENYFNERGKSIQTSADMLETTMRFFLMDAGEFLDKISVNNNRNLSETLFPFCSDLSTHTEAPEEAKSRANISDEQLSQCFFELRNWKMEQSQINLGLNTTLLNSIFFRMGSTLENSNFKSMMAMCQQRIEKFLLLSNQIQDSVNQSMHQITSYTFAENLNFAQLISSQIDRMMKEISEMQQRKSQVSEACSVLLEPKSNKHSFFQKTGKLKLQEAQNLFRRANDGMVGVDDSLGRSLKKYVAPLADLARKYFSNSITKLEWAESFTSKTNEQHLITMQAENVKVRNAVQAIENCLIRGTKALALVFRHLVTDHDDNNDDADYADFTLKSFLNLKIVKASEAYNPVHRGEPFHS